MNQAIVQDPASFDLGEATLKRALCFLRANTPRGAVGAVRRRQAFGGSTEATVPKHGMESSGA